MNRRGIALPTVLSILVISVLLALSVASSGLVTLHITGGGHQSQQSVYAAEAGLAAAIREIIQGTSGWNGFNRVRYGLNSDYSVQVIGPQAGPPFVPSGCVYLLATGRTNQKHERRVGALIQAEPAANPVFSAFGYALASASTLRMQGPTTIEGSLKSTAELRGQGDVRVIPAQGNGRILSGDNIRFQGELFRDPSQDLRARDAIRIQGWPGGNNLDPDPAALIFPRDTTPDSAPFIADGRFSNTRSSTEIGEVLPNPDPQKLLGLVPDGAGGYQKDPLTGRYKIDPARTDVVYHDETNGASMDLGGKIHFFPNGVRFMTDANFTGSGSIVTGENNDIRFQRPVRGTVNLLALKWPNQSARAEVRIQGDADLEGLIWSAGSVRTQGKLNLKGMVISYSDELRTQGDVQVVYDPKGLGLPGFNSWALGQISTPGPGTATGIQPGKALNIISWQRL